MHHSRQSDTVRCGMRARTTQALMLLVASCGLMKSFSRSDSLMSCSNINSDEVLHRCHAVGVAQRIWSFDLSNQTR